MLLLTVNSSGCASHDKQKALNKFDETSNLYGRLLRWKELEGAAQMIQHEDGSPVEIQLDELSDLEIVDYKIKTIVMDEEHQKAVVEAEISYYFETKNTVKTIRDIQNWWYSEEAQNWFMDGDLPAF